jgi:hypothetical protein
MVAFCSLFEVTTLINFICLQVKGSVTFYNLKYAEIQEPTCIYQSIKHSTTEYCICSFGYLSSDVLMVTSPSLCHKPGEVTVNTSEDNK